MRQPSVAIREGPALQGAFIVAILRTIVGTLMAFLVQLNNYRVEGGRFGESST